MFKCGPHQNNSQFLLFPKFFWEPKTLLSCLKSLKCDLGIVYSLENLKDIIHKCGWGGWYEFILACQHFANNEEFWSISRIHFQVYYYVAYDYCCTPDSSVSDFKFVSQSWWAWCDRLLVRRGNLTLPPLFFAFIIIHLSICR